MLQLSDYRIMLDGRHLLGFKNLAVRGGDVLTLMGRSGLGKTSFLLDLAGLQGAGNFSSQGMIKLDGEDIRPQLPHVRRVGYFSQRPVVFPFLSVRENLLLALQNVRTPPTNKKNAKGKYDKKTMEKKIAQALEQCQLSGFERRDPKTLSGGEIARVSLMMLILAEPKLLLLDEPFSSLNKNLRTTMKSLVLDAMDKQKIPIIMVTHQRQDALGKVIALRS